jgi:hypothetical protein
MIQVDILWIEQELLAHSVSKGRRRLFVYLRHGLRELGPSDASFDELGEGRDGYMSPTK